MTNIPIAKQQDDLNNLLPWAAHLAISRNTGLILLLTQRRKGQT